MGVRGYKVFNPDWTCRGFQYEVGKTFEHGGGIKICESGFHFCMKASDCFNYYRFDCKNKIAEIEAIGKIETYGDKSVTDKITIIREISWRELLDIVNEGHSCTGRCNTGDLNSGNYNSGNYNTGNGNTGNWNTGNWNTGDLNTGIYNSGSWNTGIYNSGNCNTGSWNTGIYNSGNCNTGSWNTGSWNTGSWNTGSWNTGSWNTGSWNKIDYSSGFFNTKDSSVIAFNKPCNISRCEFLKSDGMLTLSSHYKDDWWVNSDDMTEEEKKEHPEYETTGGYLKTVDFKTACAKMWNNMDDNEKHAVREIPNFDADIFMDITGIDVND